MGSSLNPFAGMTGAEIYHNFHGGTGDDGAGLTKAAFHVQLLVKSYNERAKAMIGLTTSMESAWQGGAGGAARRGAGPLAVEHTLAGDTMTTAGSTMGNQLEAFHSAKITVSQIPPTPDKPGVWDNLTSLGGAGRDYENQMNQVHAANDANVAAMTTYEGLSEENTSRMPTTYGRITDDHAAVGVERPPGLTPPPSAGPPPGGGTDPGSSNHSSANSSQNGSYTTPGHHNGTFTQQNNQNNTTNPNQNQTTPNDFRPPPTFDPPRNLPPGQNPGQNLNHPGLPGVVPGFGPNGGGGGPGGGRGFGPGGSGGSGGSGGRGGFGPGGSGGAGGPGSGGPGSGARGLGSGFGPGGAAAAEGAAARGGMGGPGAGAAGGAGGRGGMGGGGRKGEGEDDTEHARPTFLVEPDPHDTFGTDEVTAPPVIGE